MDNQFDLSCFVDWISALFVSFQVALIVKIDWCWPFCLISLLAYWVRAARERGQWRCEYIQRQTLFSPKTISSLPPLLAVLFPGYGWSIQVLFPPVKSLLSVTWHWDVANNCFCWREHIGDYEFLPTRHRLYLQIISQFFSSRMKTLTTNSIRLLALCILLSTVTIIIYTTNYEANSSFHNWRKCMDQELDSYSVKVRLTTYYRERLIENRLFAEPGFTSLDFIMVTFQTGVFFK